MKWELLLFVPFTLCLSFVFEQWPHNLATRSARYLELFDIEANNTFDSESSLSMKSFSSVSKFGKMNIPKFYVTKLNPISTNSHVGNYPY